MSYSRKSFIADEIRFGEHKDGETMRKFINEYLEHTGRKSLMVHCMDDFDKFCKEEIGSYFMVAEAARYGFHPDNSYFQYCSCEFNTGYEVDDLIPDDDDWEDAVQWHLDNEGFETFLEKTEIDMVEIRKAFISWCDNADNLTVEDTMMFSDEQILTVEWNELEAEMPDKEDDE